MSYTIYGLRAVDADECRYVGQTRQILRRRFSEHMTFSKLPWHQPGSFGHWLANNPVEVFAVTTVETLAEARQAERLIVETMACLGHRLFNFCLVPPKRRMPRCELEAA